MKTIIRYTIASIVFVANLIIAAGCGYAVADFMVDKLYLVGFWVFADGIVAVCVAVSIFVVLEQGAYALHISLD